MKTAVRRSKGLTVRLGPDRLLGWHLLSDQGLGYDDHRNPKKGQRLEFRHPYATVPICCKSGMHASHKINQTMRNAGRIMCRVIVEGQITNKDNNGKRHRNKFTGRYRTIIWKKRIPDSIWNTIYWDLDESTQKSVEDKLLKWAEDNGCPFVYIKN